MDDNGWSASWHNVFAVRFLDWVSDTDSGTRLPIADFVNEFDEVGHPAGYPIDEANLGQILNDLTAAGLVEAKPKLVGGVLATTTRLTAEGDAEVTRRRQRRADAEIRALACRDALLAWLYACKRVGTSAQLPTGFLADPRGHFEGDLFEDLDITGACSYLRSKGLIEGTPAWGGEIPRPSITAAGEDVVELYGGSVGDYMRSRQASAGPHITNLVHGNQNTVQAGIATGDLSQTQRATHAVDPTDLAHHLAAIREAADDLDVGDRQRILTLVQALDEAEPDELDGGYLRTLLGRMRTIAGKVGNVALTAAVTTATNQLVT